jgi:hypothetical protein
LVSNITPIEKYFLEIKTKTIQKSPSAIALFSADKRKIEKGLLCINYQLSTIGEKRMKEENYPTKERSTSQVNADVGCTINMRCLCSCQKDWNCFIFGSDERKEHLLGEKICRVIYWFSVLQMGFTPIQLIFYSFKKKSF